MSSTVAAPVGAVADRRTPLAPRLAAVVRRHLPTLLFLLALVVRLGAWWQNRGYEPFGDEQYYYRAAVIVAQTGQYADPPTPAWLPVQRVPLLSLLAGALFRLAGLDLGPVNLVQIGLSLLTCLFVWRWAARLWGERGGLVALAIAAVYPTLVSHPAAFLYTETLYTCLAALALYLLGRLGERAADWPPLGRRPLALAAAAGVAIGLTALTRSSGITLLGVALLWLALTGWRRPRAVAALGAVVVLTAALTIAPWTIRNYRAYGGWLPLDTIGAYNIWRDNKLPGEDPAAVLSRITNPIEQGRVATERGLANIRSRPDLLLARLPNGVRYLWHLELDSYARGGGYFEDLTDRTDSFAWTLWADAAFLLVTGLGLLGLALAPWGTAAPAARRLQLLLLLWIAANCLSGIIFHSESRFRIPYQPQLIVFAALPLVAWRAGMATVRAQPWRGLLAGGLLLLLLIGAWSPRLGPLLQMQGWLTVGALAEGRDGAAALAAYERATAAFPESDRPFIELGAARERAGDPAGAAAAYRAALERQPHSINAAVPLVHLHLAAGRVDEARAVLRTTGTSDNDALTWSWRHAVPPPQAALEIGSGLELGYLRNLYPPERGEAGPFRWTNGNGLLRLTVPAGGAARLTLRLNGTRLAAPPSGRVEVLANGRSLGTVATSGQWQALTFDLAPLRLAPGTPLTIEVRSDTFVPAGVVPGSRDLRRLGVAVARATLEAP